MILVGGYRDSGRWLQKQHENIYIIVGVADLIPYIFLGLYTGWGVFLNKNAPPDREEKKQKRRGCENSRRAVENAVVQVYAPRSEGVEKIERFRGN